MDFRWRRGAAPILSVTLAILLSQPSLGMGQPFLCAGLALPDARTEGVAKVVARTNTATPSVIVIFAYFADESLLRS